MSMIAAVRVRGVPDAHRKARESMESLHLGNKNNCMVFSDDEATRGRLVRAKDYIAFGTVESDTIKRMLKKRGRVDGQQLTAAIESLGFDDIAALTTALEDGTVTMSELGDNGLSIPFRLSPPSKGFKDSRRHYNQGGSLGQRDDMDDLLKRMI